jgi:hypothetical protein
VAARLEVPSKDLRAVEWDRPDLIGDPATAESILARYNAFLDEEVAGVRAMDADGSERGKVRLVLLLAGAAILLVAANVYAVSEIRSDPAESRDRETGSSPPAAPAEPRRTTTEARKRRPPPKRQTRQQPPAQPAVRLVLAAVSGDSWVEAHADSPSGAVLYQGTLASGQAIPLNGRRLWLRLGAASHLAFSLNGKPVNPGLQGTVDVLVTPQGIQPATG